MLKFTNSKQQRLQSRLCQAIEPRCTQSRRSRVCMYISKHDLTSANIYNTDVEIRVTRTSIIYSLQSILVCGIINIPIIPRFKTTSIDIFLMIMTVSLYCRYAVIYYTCATNNIIIVKNYRIDLLISRPSIESSASQFEPNTSHFKVRFLATNENTNKNINQNSFCLFYSANL